jgi:hypothetical protein
MPMLFLYPQLKARQMKSFALERIFYEIRPELPTFGHPVDVQIFSTKIVLTFCCCRQKVSRTARMLCEKILRPPRMA